MSTTFTLGQGEVGSGDWRAWEEELEAAAVAILRRPRRFTASFITCEKATSRRE